MKSELPDIFAMADGQRVQTVDDWRTQRAALQELVVGIEYGGLPPTPASVDAELLHRCTPSQLNGACHEQYRLTCMDERPFSFLLKLWVPGGEGPFPVVLTGDGCWCYRTDLVTTEVLKRDYILAEFNRTEIAPDTYHSRRETGLYPTYPDHQFGALAAWAWGYHRCVDFLSMLSNVNPDQITIAGHSRGGKAVLLAGATDERIALTAPNNSGCGGSGSFLWEGEGSETLKDILRAVPYWFGPRLHQYIDNEAALPFDQHSLKALVAPRGLLTTEALGDAWANPEGTWQTHQAAREVYRFLGASERIGSWYREGEHKHALINWLALLDFADRQFKAATPQCLFDIYPFPELPKAYAWAAPDPTTG